MACILELASASDPENLGGNQDGDETDVSNTERSGHLAKDSSVQHFNSHSQSNVSILLDPHTNHRRRNLDPNAIRSITNEKF